MGVDESLDHYSVRQVLQDLQDHAFGFRRDMPDLSGHSFRVGAALDMISQGESLAKIMLKGGWKTESTALKYLRNYTFERGLTWATYVILLIAVY